MKRILSIAIFVSLILLAGCNSNRSSYKSTVAAYENGDYETAIAGFKELKNYKDSDVYLTAATQKFAAEKISNMGDQIESQAVIDELFSICYELTPAEFAQIETSTDFEVLFVDYINALGKKAHWDKALPLIQKANILSIDCIEKSLISYGRWGCIESAENFIKEQLKSPRSYYRYNASVSTPRTRDTHYIVNVYLDYGATNSFGAEVTSEEQIVVHFYVDLENRDVRFECIGNPLDVLAEALDCAGL